jgi:hypothetical protein
MTEAFVYCWTDKKNNMLYVGSHKGSADDGYVCSSKYMLKEYNKRPSDFSRQIIAEGNLSDIRKLEAKILQAANARLDESFYNKHDNDGFYFDGWKKGEMSLEHRQKMSEAKKGKKLSESHRKNILNNRVGKKNSAEHTAALVASRIGSNHSEESKRKMSEKRKNISNLKELASNAGKKSVQARPDNYKQIQSERMKLWWAERKKKAGG